MKYSDLVTVAPRFTRAISLDRDVRLASALDGYVITTTAQSVLSRFARALREPAGHRAWTLTGPYGSGKSAFAVFAANLFGDDANPGTRAARKLLAQESDALYREFFDRRKITSLPIDGFCTVTVSGAAEPLLPSLLRACCRDIRHYCSHGRPPSALLKLEKLLAHVQKGKLVTTSEVVEGIIQACEALQRSGRSQGILLIIDELGKFLEFAARNPDADIFILQQLAEATARFQIPGLLLVTILHQSFDRYVAGLRPAVRDEWAKVQGRFEDIAYQEPSEDWLLLLSRAITHNTGSRSSDLARLGRREAEAAFDLGLAPPGAIKPQFVAALQRCTPLHPITVLVLAQLCRKFGQNQRSLFSFLVSREPSGFARFLEQDVKAELPLYRPHDLYDYAVQAFGNALTVGENAVRWAEVESALEKCIAAPEPQLNVIKTIGLLAAVGAHGSLKGSPAVLDFSLGDTKGVRKSTDHLSTRSVLVYRKHNDSFALWEGSDVDIDERLQDAQRRLPGNSNVARMLTSLWDQRRIVAKRHSIRTGTLRYFVVRFADNTDLLRSLTPDADADGLVIYTLPHSPAEVEELSGLASSPPVSSRKDLLVVVPKDIGALSDAVRELELLRWVGSNTPELQGDAVARRELQARIAITQDRLSKEIASLFMPGALSQSPAAWFYCGQRQHVSNMRSLSNLVSHVCDIFYPHTPILQNELLNRRNLSSAAAAARRNLIDAMISHGAEERLAIEGFPPEFSMYVSVLRSTGIHREEESGYAFGEPNGASGLGETWAAMTKFFATCELEKRNVVELFSILRQDPLGLKMGVIPVLFCASVLAYDTEISLYENGAFVPEITIEVFERLLKSPEKFELRRYRVAGVRREVFNRLAALVGAAVDRDEHLLPLIRPLFKFFTRLPAYTKQTKTLSPIASAVRDALFAAREPDILVFEDLPRACGVHPFSPNNPENTDDVPVFFHHLKKAFSELQRAYDDLLSEIQQLLFRAFGASGMNGREILRYRARALADHAIEPRLRSFVHHLLEDEAEDVAWIEAIGTLLTNKPPKSWADSDRARYELVLSELSRSFRHIEAIVDQIASRASTDKAPAEMLRIGVTNRFSEDLEAVVIVEPESQQKVAEMVIAIEEILDRHRGETVPNLTLAALGMVARTYLDALEKPVKQSKNAAREVPHE